MSNFQDGWTKFDPPSDKPSWFPVTKIAEKRAEIARVIRSTVGRSFPRLYSDTREIATERSADKSTVVAKTSGWRELKQRVKTAMHFSVFNIALHARKKTMERKLRDKNFRDKNLGCRGKR
jgi:hypothetical protein